MTELWLTPPATIVLVGALTAGFVQGVSGFALGLVGMVFWSGAMPPQVAAPLIALCSIAGQLQSARSLQGARHLRLAAPLVIGGVAGVPLGIALLPYVDAATFRLGLGILLCLYCPAMLALRRLPHLSWAGPAADVVVGAIGGIMGGVCALNGPAPTLWCAIRGWDRDTARGVMQAFLLTAHSAGVIGFAIAGLVTAEVLHLAAWLVPAVLLTSWFGLRLYTRLDADMFRRLVLALLLLTGITLLAQAFVGA